MSCKKILTIIKLCLIIAGKSLIKGKGKGMIMKKYQLFCGILGALISANALAYDTIKAEDEYLVRDIVKVNGDNYVVETKKNMEMVPVVNLSEDETVVIDDELIGESVRQQPSIESYSHPRDRYINGESAQESLKKQEKKQRKIMTEDGEVFVIDEDEIDGFEDEEDYIDGINECYDSRSDDLRREIAMYDDGFRGSLGNISNIMAEVNHCYEQVGYAIIADYYNGDAFMMKNFDEESKKFYVSGNDVNFDPKFCDENCSVRAILDAQIEKFAEFRIYLTKLLVNKQ